MIRNIVFDMGNVLIQWRPDLFVEGLGVPPEDRSLLLRELFGSVEWIQMDRGTLSMEDGLAAVRPRLPERLWDAAGELTRQEAELLLGFCDNCGPAFLVGYVGASVLGSPQAGARLFLIHIAAALLTGLLLCRFQPDRGPALLRTNLPAKAVDFPQALTTAASGAVASTLNICAFVVLFRVLAALAPAGIPGPALGVLEMVTGTAALSPDRTGFILAAVITGWGGLSVHCQALSTTAATGLSFRWHWAGKAVQAVIAGALALVLSAL